MDDDTRRGVVGERDCSQRRGLLLKNKRETLSDKVLLQHVKGEEGTKSTKVRATFQSVAGKFESVSR